MSGEFAYEEVRCCPVCACEKRREVFVGHDDRYGHPDVYPLVECTECGLAYLATRPMEKYVPELYRRYYSSPSVGPDHLSRGILTWCKERLKATVIWLIHQKIANPTNLYTKVTHVRDKAILDVGSGSVLAAASWVLRHGGRWASLEANEQVCAYLNRHGFSCYQQTLEQFSRSTPERFDYIVLSQVLEHVYHPVEFLKAALCLLKKGGSIIMSCPNYDSVFRTRYGTKWLHWHIPYHVSQFNRGSLEVLLQRVGLSIVEWKTVTPSAWFRAQRSLVDGERFSDTSIKSHLMLQLYLNARLWPVNEAGHGDAIITALSPKLNGTHANI